MSRLVRAAVVAASAAALVVAAPGAEAGQSGLKTVATGLNNPRHLTVHDGRLYVAEAGAGGDGQCVEGPEGPACFGLSGAVAQLDGHGGVRRILTGLPSAAAPGGAAVAGPTDVDFVHGVPAVLCGDVLIDPQTGANPFGTAGRLLGKLSFGFGRYLVPGPDFAAFEARNNPDHGAGASPDTPVIDSNPYGMTRYRDGFAVVDAAGNDLLYVDGRGRISVLAVFPPKLVTAPPALGLPPGTQIPVQSVPTSVVVGPDGALYVSELSSIAVGAARVYRVVPGHAPTVYADGFTALTDLTFDHKGRLLALTFARDGIAAPPSPGVLTRVEKNGTKTVLASAGLAAATGLVVRGDEVFVSNNGTSQGTGSVVRLVPRG
ncbi:ScyD/ScyE family protein [Amycolatopsis nalaikhensis]|uniref:ScyD/ScyE family protein n=1 Tax=Amycolatopsis nalaikhensis TaxID=715472 RepID=A0ABY8XN75_9PSEU|nr:ScyD/ScyE family protein [Amycolatopsis sp. 2-2]WIV56980.1 ScyD/ScyE family protein [Amycolatopsis sp. 2-2]